MTIPFQQQQKVEPEKTNSSDQKKDTFIWRVLVTVGITTVVVVLLLFIWHLLQMLLVVFAGILLALFLRGLSSWLRKPAPLPEVWSVAVVVAVLAIVIGAGIWFLAPSVADQISQLSETVPRSIDRLEQYVPDEPWARSLVRRVPTSLNEMMNQDTNSSLWSRAAGVFSTTLGALTNLAIILFIGLYIAFNPRVYIKGVVHLVPIGKRKRAWEVLDNLGETLQRWLIGRVASMAVVGIFSAIGLMLLGVPLALTLGLLAGLLSFIPYIGPILSVVPAALLGLSESPVTALYVLLLYAGIQVVESYLLTPLIQKEAVSLPPALTITGQIILGVLAGGLGVVFATPLTAATVVLVKMLYVEDTLQKADRL